PHMPDVHTQVGDLYRIQSALITNETLLVERQLIAKRAVDSYQKSLELNPYNSEVVLKMAAACEIGGDTNTAFRWYQRSMQIDPNSEFNWVRLGLFYSRQGDTNRAVDALTQAQKLNPGDHTPANLLKELQSPQP